jgi:hypothetical protein
MELNGRDQRLFRDSATSFINAQQTGLPALMMACWDEMPKKIRVWASTDARGWAGHARNIKKLLKAMDEQVKPDNMSWKVTM